jgi:hypothetical protein
VLAFNCPACNHYGEADPALAGEIIGCANCLTHFRLPGSGAPSVDAPQESRPSVKEPGKGAVVERWARCHLCGARRTDSTKCTFCGFEFGSPDQREIEERRRYRRQVGMQFGAVLALMGALIGIPGTALWLKTANDTEKTLCQENLLIFHQAVKLAEERPAGVTPLVGRAFLISIGQIEKVNHALMCPAVNRNGTLRAVDYRGPGKPWAELLPEDPVVVDLEGNHRGVMVLRKNGQIEYASRGSALYRRALEETKD